MEEFQDRVAQGLEYARKLFQDFIPPGLPSVPSVPGGDVEAPAPSPPDMRNRDPPPPPPRFLTWPSRAPARARSVLLRPGQAQGVRREVRRGS